MARSTAYDAYEKFRFTVTWSDSTSDAAGSAAAPLTRAGFHDIDLPQRTTTIGEYREGLDGDFVQLFEGLNRYSNVAMHRGVTSSEDFYNWALDCHNSETHKGQVTVAANQSTSLAAGSILNRKDLIIELFDRSGAIVKAWRLLNCTVVDFKPGDKLDSAEDSVKLMEELSVRPEEVYELSVVDGVVTGV